MVVDRSERKRLLSEGRQFLRFLRERKTRRRHVGTADPVSASWAPNR
jgi:hypothetical protein